MFSGHKMQSHFLWVKTSLSSCQITGVHTANERRSHISKSNCFAKIPYNETNSPGNFMSKCGQLNQDLCTFPSNLSNCSSHLPWPEAKSLNLPPGRLAGRCCCSAQPALPCQLLGQSQEFLICCLLLVAVHGTVILFGSMARKRCKSRRERCWMMYSSPMLQQYQIRV